MEAAAIAMQEVVVTGYGTQQRRDITGAMATVKAEDLTPIAAPSVDQMLQGRVAGVQVIPSSGKPGDNAVIRIRGIARSTTLPRDRKSTRLNSSHGYISYAVFCLKKKKKTNRDEVSGRTVATR